MIDRTWVLVLNCGSSSVKCGLLDPATGERRLTALAEGVGSDEAVLRVEGSDGPEQLQPRDSSYRGIVDQLIAMATERAHGQLAGVGHRVVHGGDRFGASVVIDEQVLDAIRAVSDLAPLHNPANLIGIEAVTAALPECPQVAVFDTAFHRTMPPVAYRYAVPGAWYDEHRARRYGFHGTSHRYVSGRAAELLGRPLDSLRMVTAHLGNGCSATAVRDGRSVDTTMGFTPLEGLVMGTRSGDIDAGLLGYMAERLDLDLPAVLTILNFESGLKGLSGVGNDMRSITDAARAGNDQAALALAVFTYRLAKAVAALSVPLERLDALVLTGGIGENSVDVRSAVMRSLVLFGIREDVEANADHGRSTNGRVSQEEATVVLVVPTNEELVIAHDTARLVVTDQAGGGSR
ncbi:MAG: acetate/propionate family kinase [Actinomycetes bacterium]